MTLRRLIIAAAAMGLCSLSGAESLTLNASLERTRANNPQLLLAGKELSIAKTQLRQAKSLYYPKVNLNLDYVRYRNETVGITSPELGGVILEAPIAASRNDPRGNPLAQDLYLGRIGFLQTLYSGGKINTTHRLSKANVRRAESAVESTRSEVEYETTQLFYRLVALRDEQRMLNDTLVEINKLTKQTSGAHGRLALAAAQLEMQKRLSDSKQEQQTIMFKYLQSMGLELFSDVQVEGDFGADPALPELQTVLAWAKQNRTELKDTQIQEEVDQLSVELSRSERYPVFLWGGGVEVRDSEFPLKDTNWNTALTMNIPVFDGFRGYARVKESRYRADQGRLRRVQLEDQVEIEVRSAHGDWDHWKNEVEARRKQLSMLEELKKEAFGKNQSANSLSERIDYLRWRADATVSLTEAQYELCASRARLAKAVGRSVDNP